MRIPPLRAMGGAAGAYPGPAAVVRHVLTWWADGDICRDEPRALPDGDGEPLRRSPVHLGVSARPCRRRGAAAVARGSGGARGRGGRTAGGTMTRGGGGVPFRGVPGRVGPAPTSRTPPRRTYVRTPRCLHRGSDVAATRGGAGTVDRGEKRMFSAEPSGVGDRARRHAPPPGAGARPEPGRPGARAPKAVVSGSS